MMRQRDQSRTKIGSHRAWHAAPYLIRHAYCRANLSCNAVAALKSIVFAKRLLERMQFAIRCETFDGGDRAAFLLNRQREARKDPVASH
jgi:hypothetical protein